MPARTDQSSFSTAVCDDGDDSTVIAHERHWYDGEMIIVQVENTSFKLHDSRLAKESKWFREKLSLKGSEDAINSDGCKIYVVGQANLGIVVTKRSFAALVDAMEDAIKYMLSEDSIPRHGVICDILYAATALGFTRYRAWAVSRLEKHYWSSDLKTLRTQPSWTVEICERAIVTSRECNVPSILKRALYELVRRPDYWKGGLDDPNEVLQSLEITLAGARLKLAQEWSSRASLVIPTLAEDSLCCKYLEPAPHESAFGHAYTSYMHHGPKGLFRQYLFDPIAGLLALSKKQWETPQICKGCVKKAQAGWIADRQKLWDRLDEWLGLETVS
ncbi:hypothetical protein GYMLUDRAFT_394053 [Collybiopsis luxurians FD-317 M1]|uniref:Unplaced genomic scaffold GYMLUscaffold_114, whole genome shotgun sequence n=1 Tax=Collybiopsis luxurians FD-317 M1 TaxID=944289 RepID=A0A0D0AMN7_9AGAR|nr:hypothetical protein GYMLUDRAFT_394053 [Collybiopsis luxurians FD-317 M1]